MRTLETGLPGVVVIEPAVHGDHRGYFMESWNARRYASMGLPETFVQANLSRSAAGVIRGLHFQYPQSQGKLVSVLEGRAFDVAVDIRVDSPTFRQWVAVELSAENCRQLYIPEGFAHGFCTLGGPVLLSYLCTREYAAECDAAIAWDDPGIGIDWPLSEGELSAKDAVAPRLEEIAEDRLPRMPT
ncbi:MAG: dTDP-4-dehydrorhamnose 3,5-epimerase [Xanthomonadales bacterium]|nr:dTDP-4-dehydrorhamnose 3,5-epimerase [Xanthomonadales bacterium]